MKINNNKVTTSSHHLEAALHTLHPQGANGCRS